MGNRCSLIVVGFVAFLASNTALFAQKLVINRREFGNYVALWRISHDPAVDDHANYHMQSCWSPDGHYLSYTHREIVPAPDLRQPYVGRYRPIVHVYDFLANQERTFGRGIMQGFGPCWANNRNWLFFVQSGENDGRFAGSESSPVMWLDADTGKVTKIGDGLDQLGGVDCNDEWVYGGIKDTARKPAFRAARVRIAPQGGVQELRDVTGFQWMPNPRHPVLHTRHDHLDEPFGANRWFWNLDGTHRRIGQWGLETCHAAWQGNGEYLLLGDGLARGRRWNEPATGNVHVLAAAAEGNLSACGRTGRFLVGDTRLFDTRSGDGWLYKHWVGMKLIPSQTMYPIFDSEAKGSPDGTKVVFTDHYDMEKGPVTVLTQQHGTRDDVLRVKSTEGFPPSGALVVRREVVGYKRKTATTFEELERGQHGTFVSLVLAGDPVTDFRHHCLTDEQWKTVKTVGTDLRMEVKDFNSPLMRQRRKSIWVMAVHRPDRPWLLPLRGAVQLIPGESHYETFGYHLAHNGRRFTTRPVRAGERFRLTPGQYSAVAVEWSGLESEPSTVLNLTTPGVLQVLADAPKDFSWTRDRWLVNKTETPAAAVAMASEAIREIVHLYDGVIAREWYRKGVLTQHHDLNHEGKAIRRLTYEGGKLATRDYHNREDEHVSRELFAADGFITETIRMANYGNTVSEADHWWFEKGTPVRRVAGRTEYVKDGEKWTPK